MIWRQEWIALSRRIASLLEAGNVFARFLRLNSSDLHHGGKELREQATQLYDELRDFRNRHSSALPGAASNALNRWLEGHQQLFSSRPPAATGPNNIEVLKAMLPMIGAIESEVNYRLLGHQEQLRVRSERAFEHLQRSIVADPDLRARWEKAFDSKEPDCERLGAVHLLWHGIWAFKVDAVGGRTDLVFQEPMDDLSRVDRAADGLVLTEWKLARGAAEASRSFEDARKQAQRYASGALAGIELRSHQYAVVVTENRVNEPDDVRAGDIVYRHVNIAVAPKPPSRA